MTEPIQLAYDYWQNSSQKLEYFLAGVSSALFAYEAQQWEAVPLGGNPFTLTFVALLLLIASFFLTLKRLEAFSQLFRISHLKLFAEAIRVHSPSPDTPVPIFDLNTWQPMTREQLKDLHLTYQEIDEKYRKKLNGLQRRGTIYYELRNATLLLGFLLLVVAKVWSGYI